MSTIPHHAFPEYLAARQAAVRRDRWVILLTLSLAVVCFISAGFFLAPMNEVRKENQLVINPESFSGLPPDIELLSKLGTFRALAIDWAFIRSERLKEEGKNYEAYQLSSLICKLQPRFASVWDFNAWNMAYNISVNYYTPEARWQWVRNGILLLRDEGIKYNPKSVTLYKTLAFIYWHKIGDFLDDEHMNYKRALAVEMERVLGPPVVALTAQDTIDAFRKIAESAADLQLLYDSDPAVYHLRAALEEAGLPPDRKLLEIAARHLRPEIQISELTETTTEPDPQLASQLAILTNPDNAEALDRLLAAVRSKTLREELKLDPKYMLALMEQYGPIDWRAAWAHCLYWATYGDIAAKGQLNINPADSMNAVRFIFFALKQAVSRGRMVVTPDFDNPFRSYVEFMPDIRYIPYLYDAYMTFGKEQFGDDPRFREGTPGPNYWAGFVSEMHSFIQLLCFEGGKENVAQAEEYYAYLRRMNKHPNGETQEQYTMPLRDFVLKDLKAQLQTYRQAGAFIRRWIQKSFRELSLGNVQASTGSLANAREFYREYMDPTRTDRDDRRKLQPFYLMRADELVNFMTRPEIPVIDKARLWRRLDYDLQQLTWDRVRPYYEKLCENYDPPLKIEKAFLEPPGMEEFRKQEIDRRHGLEKDFDVGERH